MTSFGNYVANALSELESRACHLAQNKINNIIFEAQAGILVHEMQPPMMWPHIQHDFQPILQPRHMPPSTRTASPYADHNSSFTTYNRTSGW